MKPPIYVYPITTRTTRDRSTTRSLQTQVPTKSSTPQRTVSFLSHHIDHEIELFEQYAKGDVRCCLRFSRHQRNMAPRLHELTMNAPRKRHKSTMEAPCTHQSLSWTHHGPNTDPLRKHHGPTRAYHGLIMDPPLTKHEPPWTHHGSTTNAPWTLEASWGNQGGTKRKPWTHHGHTVQGLWTHHESTMETPRTHHRDTL